jgi:hypothetical protein
VTEGTHWAYHDEECPRRGTTLTHMRSQGSNRCTHCDIIVYERPQAASQQPPVAEVRQVEPGAMSATYRPAPPTMTPSELAVLIERPVSDPAEHYVRRIEELRTQRGWALGSHRPVMAAKFGQAMSRVEAAAFSELIDTKPE